MPKITARSTTANLAAMASAQVTVGSGAAPVGRRRDQDLIARRCLWLIEAVLKEALRRMVADISDGLDALRSVMSLRELASLIERI
jgi:hypothetical protein